MSSDDYTQIHIIIIPKNDDQCPQSTLKTPL